MKKITFIIAGMLLAGGCIPLIIGAGMVTGYSLSNDAAIGNVKSDYRLLWDTSMTTLEEMEAEFISVNESKGFIKAIIQEKSVVVKINTISTEFQRLKVSSRKSLFPKPQFSQKIFLKIIEGI